jgi:hypothetical protein
MHFCRKHKYTWTTPNGKTYKQIDDILIYRRWLSSILHVQSFNGADCDTDHCLVVAKVRGRLAVSKQQHRRKLSELQVRQQYRIKI